MDLSYSPEEQAFRAEVRDFLETRLPKDMAAIRWPPCGSPIAAFRRRP